MIGAFIALIYSENPPLRLEVPTKAYPNETYVNVKICDMNTTTFLLKNAFSFLRFLANFWNLLNNTSPVAWCNAQNNQFRLT